MEHAMRKRIPPALIIGLSAGLALMAAGGPATAASPSGRPARWEVRLAPQAPSPGVAMRWSPKGEKLILEEAGGGWETYLKIGPAGNPPIPILLSMSPGAAHFDLLTIDRNGNGKLGDEIGIRTTPSETRGKLWSSFAATLEISVTDPDGRIMKNAYPLSFWYVEDPKAKVQEPVLRYSRSGWMEGSVRIDGTDALVLLTESRMDGVFDRFDSWALAPAGERAALFTIEGARSCSEHAWLGEKAYRLAEIHPSGRRIVLEPYDPGLTRAEEKARADTMAADRNAPRSRKAVEFKHDFAAAESEAKTRGTALFIDFETVWCGPCKSMDEWVYTADEVAAAAGAVVAVKVDGDERRDLAKRFDVAAYPTLVLVAPDGRVLKKAVGYQSVKETAAFLRADEKRSVISIGPGIDAIEIKRGDFTAEPGVDRWTINALVLDPAKARLELGIALDEIVGAETTSSIAARHGALAAVNGGYFRTAGLLKGEPAGLMALAGRVLSEPAKGRASLAAADIGGRTRIAVAHVRFKAELAAGAGISCPIDGFNRDRGPNEMIVFTPEFHRTTLTDPGGIEAVVRGGTTTEIRDHAGSTPIPADGIIVSGRGAAAEWIRVSLKPGAKAEIKTSIEAEPPLPFPPDFLIGGGPRLLSGGKSVPSEADAYPEGFYATRHPRTAIGARADGIVVLVAVDGRQPKVGVGMSIAELASLMAELGCVEALNLDGGGSTTMVVKGKIVNSPSDAAGERAVSDALLVFAR
jgi:thiol-disulfide isomerase/thioredoxin